MFINRKKKSLIITKNKIEKNQETCIHKDI